VQRDVPAFLGGVVRLCQPIVGPRVHPRRLAAQVGVTAVGRARAPAPDDGVQRELVPVRRRCVLRLVLAAATHAAPHGHAAGRGTHGGGAGGAAHAAVAAPEPRAAPAERLRGGDEREVETAPPQRDRDVHFPRRRVGVGHVRPMCSRACVAASAASLRPLRHASSTSRTRIMAASSAMSRWCASHRVDPEPPDRRPPIERSRVRADAGTPAV
jgi:hypothetical protein